MIISSIAYSQQQTEERNTSKVLSKNANVSVMEMLNEANKQSETNAQKSMELATTALEKSIKQKDKTGEYYSYNTLGTLYYNIGNYTKATFYFRSASNGFATLKNDKGKAYSDKYLALSLEKQKKYAEALVVVEKADKKNSVFKKKEEMVRGGYDNARLKSKAGKKQEAIKDLEILAKDTNANVQDKIDIYKELGDLYVEKKDTANAYRSYYNALEVGRNDNSTINTGKFEAPLQITYAEVANKISFLNISNGKAKDNFLVQNKLLTDGLNSNNFELVQTANYNIGTTFIEENDDRSAIPYLFQSVKYARKTNNAINEQKSVKELAIAFENLGQYDKALDVYKRYVRLSDSFNSLNAGNKEASLALNQEFLKQEEKIKGLMSTQREKEASIKRQRNIVWTLASGLLVFVLLTWALVRNIKQKQKANMVIKLQSLRTQMNPHFIFNSLNSVNSFIAKNDERSANKYLSDFSKLMRTVLKNSDQDFVGLASEIQTLGIYLDLEHFRFGDKFDYNLEVDDNVEPDAFQIPPMLVQPYIENAIWHGLRYKEEKGMLEVKFFIENKKLYCTIFDNGIGRKRSSELKTLHQKSYQSTGIKNTQERIDLLNKMHKTSLGISISDIEENGIGMGTLVKISLPYRMNELVY